MEEAVGKIDRNTVRWYAICTAPKAEERVKKMLEQLGVECYFPLQSIEYMWANHKKKLLMPIVPRLIFISLSEVEIPKFAALKVVSFLMSKEGEYVSVSSEQLERVYIDGLENLIV